MQSKQFELCQEVLCRLHTAGVLRHFVLIGSWCLVVYREYFREVGVLHAVRTRDMDFLVPQSQKFHGKVDVPELLNELGFITGFRGQHGVMMLEHPEVMIEFLVPEHSRGSDKPKDLPQFGVNAQALRFMDIALMMTIQLPFGAIPVTVPHPAAFALHKLLIVPRRTNAEKKQKDLDSAVQVLKLLDKKGELFIAKDLLVKFPKPWKKVILKTLGDNRQDAIAQHLTSFSSHVLS